jgi:hypothetical protein
MKVMPQVFLSETGVLRNNHVTQKDVSEVHVKEHACGRVSHAAHDGHCLYSTLPNWDDNTVASEESCLSKNDMLRDTGMTYGLGSHSCNHVGLTWVSHGCSRCSASG